MISAKQIKSDSLICVIMCVYRLRIELSNPPPEHRSSTQPPDTDLPLSEGFHWESIPVSPSATHLTLPPPPPQVTTEVDSHRDEHSGSLLPEPGTSDQGASSHTVTAAPGRAEPSVRLESGGLSSANKRKQNKVSRILIQDKVSPLNSYF